jgi:hypothetical protein
METFMQNRKESLRVLASACEKLAAKVRQLLTLSNNQPKPPN